MNVYDTSHSVAGVLFLYIVLNLSKHSNNIKIITINIVEIISTNKYMNIKIIGGLLALVIIIQVVLIGTGTKMSEKINVVSAQQASILSSISRIISSGEPEPDEPGGFTISYDTFYLYGRCTTTVVSFSDQPPHDITGVETYQGTTVGDTCRLGAANTGGTSTEVEVNTNIMKVKDGVVSITNSPEIIKSQFSVTKTLK